MLVLRLLNEFLRTLQTQLSIGIGYRGRARVQAELFQKLQALSLKYHKSQPQGDGIYRLSYDTHGFHGVLNIVLGVVVNVGALVMMLVTMLTLNVKLTLVALLVVPALYLTITQWSKTLYRYAMAQKTADQEVTTQIQRSLAVVGLVQSFNRENDELARFTASQSTYIAASLRLHWQEILYWLVLGTILTVGSVAMFAYGGVLVVHKEMSIATLTLFIGYLGGLYDPLNRLSGSNAGLQSARAGVERVFEVLDQDPIITDSPHATHLPVKPRALALNDVHFSYRSGAEVLRGVSARAEIGQMIGFVGESGVGKTTLLNLLPRFYDPTQGSMTLDGIDVRGVRVRDLRKHVALVLQDSVILPTTVAENIAYGRPEATLAEVRRAAELSGAAVFIERLEHGYDTIINESGGNLSGGQKQRISIARALCTHAPIIVLDEPTSALDPQHEAMITATLRELKRERTIVLVSHRLSTVADCDCIYVMHDGQVVEQGTHDSLIAMRGHYYAMAKHQMRLDD
jgi:subfamily B ATP-binding cassette protein MsbA